MTIPLIPENDFPPSRNSPCFCGSGERYKNCCGSQAPDRRPPAGISIVRNYLSQERCRELIELADARSGRPFTIKGADGVEVINRQRMTEWVNFRDNGQEILDELIATAFTDVVLPRQGVDLDFYEEPQLLRYTPGGYYMNHSDGYIFVPEKNSWRKVVDRDLSVLIYLNDDYTGGGLRFKRFGYTLQPEAGMLVWFPSDVRYEHMAMELLTGKRYALVSWASVAGVEKVQAQRANRAIDWKTREKLIR